jgi:thermopsin
MPTSRLVHLLTVFAVAATAASSFAFALAATSAGSIPVFTMATPSPGGGPPAAAAVVGAGVASADPAGALAQAALAAAHSRGVNPRDVFVPRPSASAPEQAAALADHHVLPLYNGTPAPMGLADYGLSAGAGGVAVPSVLNTTSLMAEVDENATGIQAYDLMQSSPDSYAIELNAVVTNVTLFGSTSVPGTGVPYQFWTQNVVEYYPSAGLMILVSNVWNFTGGPLSSNTFFSHAARGIQVGTAFYYDEQMVPSPVSYPFNLTLYENSTVNAGRDAIDFAAHLTNQFGSASYPFDSVTFNSIATGGSPVTFPANYSANGFGYNPVGLPNDFELVVGGPGSGSQATLFDADANLGLAYWDGSGYVSVPSAFSYGGETGETVTGANVAWSDAAGGPAGLGTFGTMTTGPSLLTGLWNAAGTEGSFPVKITVTPRTAFVLVTPSGSPSPFLVLEPSMAPNAYTDTFWLAPGNYSVLVELSDYVPARLALNVTGPVTVSAVLPLSTAEGIYTPLWAFANSELRAISLPGGGGTTGNPYILFNDQSSGPAGEISAAFGLYNDFGFPAYPGVFLVGTNASVELERPASFATATNTSQYPGPELPSSNDLPFWFWGVSNVSIVGASGISGWFVASAYAPTTFDPFNVVFYESTHNLIASDQFHTQAQALLLFSGSTFFGHRHDIGSGSNVVWDSNFSEVAAPAACPGPGVCLPLLGAAHGLGIELAESNDLVYNNYIATPTTAWQLPVNLDSGYPELFVNDRWNITDQPASFINFDPGFSIPLTGSIVGTLDQGGNFWWDYGSAHNPANGANDPYGALPYDENATTILGSDPRGLYDASYLYPGGDYAPLVPTPLYPVTFKESGLPAGYPWGAAVSNPTTSFEYIGFTTGAVSFVTELPNGAYAFASSAGGSFGTSSGGTFRVDAHAIAVTVAFHPNAGYAIVTAHETGLPVGTAWTLALNGTSPITDPFNATKNSTSATIQFPAADGEYAYTVGTVPGYVPTIVSRSIGVTGPLSLTIRFVPEKYPIVFTETGLARGTVFKAVVTDGIHLIVRFVRAGLPITIDLPNGTYPYRLLASPGWMAENATGTVVLNGSGAAVAGVFARVLYTVSFAETGLPTAALWTVVLAGHANHSFESTANFSVPNGTFYFRIVPVQGYHQSILTGYVRVHGAAVTLFVTFTAAAVPVGFNAVPALAVVRPS